jgi:hypothetical protein
MKFLCIFILLHPFTTLSLAFVVLKKIIKTSTQRILTKKKVFVSCSNKFDFVSTFNFFFLLNCWVRVFFFGWQRKIEKKGEKRKSFMKWEFLNFQALKLKSFLFKKNKKISHCHQQNCFLCFVDCLCSHEINTRSSAIVNNA